MLHPILNKTSLLPIMIHDQISNLSSVHPISHNLRRTNMGTYSLTVQLEKIGNNSECCLMKNNKIATPCTYLTAPFYFKLGTSWHDFIFDRVKLLFYKIFISKYLHICKLGQPTTTIDHLRQRPINWSKK